MLDLSDRQNGGGDEQAEGEGYADAHEGVYSSVHGTGDEKGVLMPRCSMKSVAPSSAHGECTVQSHIQTPMGRTLLREGGFQREKLAGDSTLASRITGHVSWRRVNNNNNRRRVGFWSWTIFCRIFSVAKVVIIATPPYHNF